MTLPRNMGGFGIPSILHISKKMILGKRFTLRNSAHDEIKQMWSDTSFKNIEADSILCATPELSEAKKSMENALAEESASHVHSLGVQGLSVRGISISPKSRMECWSKLVDNLPEYLFRFVRKAFQQQLPTTSNLARWRKRTDPNCSICKKAIPQTNKHLLSSCSALLGKYTDRHNAILELIVRWLAIHKSTNQSLLVDLPLSRFDSIDRVFHPSVRPDIVIREDTRVLILELTVCHESNLEKSKDYKMNKYRDINIHLLPFLAHIPVLVFTIEVSVLGIVSSTKPFMKAANLPDIPLSLLTEISKSAIASSFEIYRTRNNVQSEPA